MNLFEVIWKSSRALDDECLFCVLSYAFKVKHLQQNETSFLMGRINLHCWQRCYDKAHVWSPRLTSVGKIWSNQIFWCFKTIDYQTLMLFHGFSALQFPNQSILIQKVSLPIEAIRMGPPPLRAPPSPPVASEASTIDAWHETQPPTLAKYGFLRNDISQTIMTRMHSQQWYKYSVPISDIIQRYIIQIHM